MNQSKPSNHRQTIKDSGKYLTANIFAQGLGLVRAIVLPVLFNPAQLGIWNLMNVVINYGAISHLGLLHGMNKAIPFLSGQGKPEEVERIKDSVFWLNLVFGVVAGGILWIVAATLSAGYSLNLKIVAWIVFLQMIFLYFFSLLRADNRFGLVSRGIAGQSLLSTALILLLGFGLADSLSGALLGVALAFLLIVGYWLWKARYHFSLQLRWQSVGSAFALGLPLIILGLLDMVFMSVDRWVIAAKLGETQLGYYALAFMAANLLYLVPVAVANVLYPQMLERFATAGDYQGVSGLLLVPLRALAVLMLVLVGGATIALPLFIQLFLPKYLPSIPIIEILIPAAYLISFSTVGGNYLVAVNRQRVLMPIQIVATLFSLLLDFILLRAGYGVLGVAWGTAAGYLLYGSSYLLASAYLAMGNKSEALRFLASLLMPFLSMVIAMALANRFVPLGVTPAEYCWSAVWKSILVAALLFPAIWVANRKENWVGVMRTEVHAWLAARGSR
jgi:PST family polysaccharide transporter